MVKLTNGSSISHEVMRDEDAIAIIGMAARLPQDADTSENLWKLLLEARNTTTPFPSERVNHEAHYHPDPEHSATVSRARVPIHLYPIYKLTYGIVLHQRYF